MFVVCFYCTPSGWCPAVCGKPGQSGRGDDRQPKRPCRKREAGAWNPQGRISAVAEPSGYKKTRWLPQTIWCVRPACLALSVNQDKLTDQFPSDIFQDDAAGEQCLLAMAGNPYGLDCLLMYIMNDVHSWRAVLREIPVSTGNIDSI